VDDALALAFAVASDVSLVGISTVAGNTNIDNATENTRRVLSALGAESVPVHRGASRPLVAAYHNAEHVHGQRGLGGVTLNESRAPESSIDGVQAILGAAERHSGQLVLVALGPLTNVAIALNIRPQLSHQVAKLVVMSGAFYVPGNATANPVAEFNAFVDPHAAEQVMAADWTHLIAVGLDVTHQTVISRDQWEGIEAGGPATRELTRQIVERTFTARKMAGFYLHDPLAVAVALDDSLVTTQALSIDVAIDEEYRGKTSPAGRGRVRVATGVDAARFERMFAERLAIPVREGEVAAERID
jgi:purine nucleosidase/pyrimidine-specific ribonucleoside hydrolase